MFYSWNYRVKASLTNVHVVKTVIGADVLKKTGKKINMLIEE